MRFRSQLTNIAVFAKLTASLSSLGKVCWVRLEDEAIRFTIIPDQGTQVWAQLPIDALFESYTIEAAAGVINLEVPIGSLNRALRSALRESTAQLRLTKKGPLPLLALTVVRSSWTDGKNPLGVRQERSSTAVTTAPGQQQIQQQGDDATSTSAATTSEVVQCHRPRERETVITQEIPVRVLHPTAVENLHQPRCPEPDVHIVLPPLIQLKAISERFIKLALGGSRSATGPTSLSSAPAPTAAAAGGIAGSGPKLELSANMHGSLKLAITTDALRISSVWSGLVNPSLDPAQLSQSALEQHPSERMRAMGAEGDGREERGWAKVRIDGKDWSRVLSVGRLSPKVVAAFIHDTALILYVYLPGDDDCCLTYYINSYAS
ncbi:hypothetical protein VTO42DRAFT_8067 [Malbranchea cinnamomea]